MASEVSSILKLQVPLIVQVANRRIPLDEVLSLAPGAIVELDKDAEEPLDLLVNNKEIGIGEAVKVGENFGVSVLRLGSAQEIVQAMGQ